LNNTINNSKNTTIAYDYQKDSNISKKPKIYTNLTEKEAIKKAKILGSGSYESKVGNTAKYKNGIWHVPVYSKSTGKIIEYIEIPDNKEINMARLN